MNDELLGFEVEVLPGGMRKITGGIPLENVGMSWWGDLLLRTELQIKVGDVVVVNDIEMVVVACEQRQITPRYNWVLTVECDQPEALSELLTYTWDGTRTAYLGTGE